MSAPMSAPTAGDLDFPALRTLRLVHELGSFTAAADRLDVNQSAVSYTIGKLRLAFGDPLFVREGGRQVPTLRCERLLSQAAEVLDLLDRMSEPDIFDPVAATQPVTIACNYYERILFMPRVVALLRNEAPNMPVRVVNSLSDGPRRLLSREADVLVGPLGQLGSGFHSARIHAEEYACLMDPSHPAASGELTVQGYLALRHLLIDYGGSWKSAYLQELEAAGHRLSPALSVPSPAGLSQLLRGSDLVATVPRRLGMALADGLALRDCPFRGRFDLSVVWTSRTHGSALHRWLRAAILRGISAV